MKRLNHKGQAAIIFTISILILNLLIAMVVNIGMLVHYKINLQNAADLAAYAGASVQARAMTWIAHINYNLRQNYKEFLFKYYVLGNLGLDSFPGSNSTKNADISGSELNEYPFTAHYLNKSQKIAIPRVCVFVKGPDNYCNFDDLPELVDPRLDVSDPIVKAFYDVRNQIINAKVADLGTISERNALFLNFWLYNVRIPKNIDDPTDQVNLDTATIPGSGRLGLVPANIINSIQIRAIQETYFNGNRPVLWKLPKGQNENSLFTAQQNVFKNEQPILAFKTALKNLNDQLKQDDVTMEEFIPRGLDLEEVKVDIEPVFTDQASGKYGGGGSRPRLAGIPVSKLPVAYYKNPNSPIYYGVKLTAKANLLFNPFSKSNDLGPTLEAVAFAKPFGGVIGPKLKDTDFYYDSPKLPAAQGKEASFKIPNISILPDDDKSKIGFKRNMVLYDLCKSMDCDRGRIKGDWKDMLDTGTQTNTPNAPDKSRELVVTIVKIVNQAIDYARSVDAWEVGKYLIPVQWNSEHDQSPISHSGLFFRGDGKYASVTPTHGADPRKSIYTIPIPIEQEEMNSKIRDALQLMGGSAQDKQFAGDLLEKLAKALQDNRIFRTFVMYYPATILPELPEKYLQDANDSEILPPYHQKIKASTVSLKHQMRDPALLMTAWFSPEQTADNSTTPTFTRRAEYSVKLVNAEMLRKDNQGNDTYIDSSQQPGSTIYLSGNSDLPDLGNIYH